jgi:NAD(P)-dependent dehydrogenase (short-subunit alcohol dehydrogenase family)
LGSGAGSTVTTGSNNIAIGFNAALDSITASNQINVGNVYYHDRITESKTFTGNVGFYNATKYAVDGLSEALQKEVSPLGIKVTIIAPSGFRTDWAGRSANSTKIQIEDYKETAGKNIADIRIASGNQPGDPNRAAAAMIQVVESENPPLRLLLGAGALKGARIKLEELQNDFENWASLTTWADAPKAE